MTPFHTFLQGPWQCLSTPLNHYLLFSHLRNLPLEDKYRREVLKGTLKVRICLQLKVLEGFLHRHLRCVLSSPVSLICVELMRLAFQKVFQCGFYPEALSQEKWAMVGVLWDKESAAPWENSPDLQVEASQLAKWNWSNDIHHPGGALVFAMGLITGDYLIPCLLSHNAPPLRTQWQRLLCPCTVLFLTWCSENVDWRAIWHNGPGLRVISAVAGAIA